jgi:hypothetical protein
MASNTNPILRPDGTTGAEEVDVKQKSLFAHLKKLFSSGVVVRNVGGKKIKVKDTSDLMYATDRNSLRDRFNRVRSTSYNAYTRDFSLAYQAARIDLFRDYDCVGPDTIIPLPDGTNPTIKELAEKYKDKPQERFYVFSYDHETDSIKLGKAYHPRKKDGGNRKCWKVIFDNDQYIIGSAGHPFLMRNGEYKKLEHVKIGDSMMPFYQKDFYSHGYRHIYNFSKGWQSEHKIVAEQFNGSLKDNFVVHHRDFNKGNNLPENLQVMTETDHKSYHAKLLSEKIWGPENKEETLRKVRSNPNYKNRKFHKWNGERAGENNPFFGKQHTEEANQKRSETLKEVFKDRDQSADKNPKFRDDLTIDVLKIKANELYKENGKLTLWELVDYVGCDYSTFQNRLKWNNISWNDFKNEVVCTLNHKVKSIEYIGEMEVYDVTVEKYQNFATDSVIIHNTMDMDPIIASALDIYADECLTLNELGKVLVVHAEDENIKGILNNLFYDILNIEHNLWSWTRNTCKYGDFFMRLYISPEYGIYQIEPISAYNVERIENTDPLNKNYVKFQIRPTDTSQVQTLEFFECAHFRLLSDSNFLPYGKSMVEGGRRVWKQLSLMEDAMLIHRIMRAPERRIFKVDVGNIPPGEIDAFIEKQVAKMKKTPYVDPSTGDYNLRFNLQNMIEDFIIPVRGNDSGTTIDTLSGMEFTGIDDIEYLRNKLMAALKIPKAFLGYEEELSGKATLASEDVRFARTIQRIQRIIVSELEKIAIVHLYSQGYRDESLVNFKLDLTNPSTVFEREKIEIWGNKVDVAQRMMEVKLFSRTWIYKNVFHMSEDDIDGIQKDIIDDSKQLYRFKSIEDEGNDPAQPFKKINPNPGQHVGGGMGGPGDFGGIGGGPPLGGPGDLNSPGGLPPTTGAELPPPPLTEDLEDSGSIVTSIDSVDEGHGEHAKDWVRPSQKGVKDARMDYPFGEDPMGDKENKAKVRPGREISHKFANNSPLSLETMKKGPILKSLDEFLKSVENNKKGLLAESPKTKSILDETNIIDD